MTRLVEKAKKFPNNKLKKGEEYEELAIAWLKGEVGLEGVGRAVGKKYSGNVLYSVAVWLRDAYQNGKIVIKK